MTILMKVREKLEENVASLAGVILVTGAVAVWGWARSYIYVEIPTGAVVAFDLADGCPQDGKWTAFADGNGRTIVGAFQGAQASEVGDDGQPIAVHKYHDRSGGESIKLTLANLPPINVPLFFTTTGEVGDKPAPVVRGISPDSGNNTVQLRAGGTAERLSRQMPNLALFFCKKTK